jgi:hypothetical protein
MADHTEIIAAAGPISIPVRKLVELVSQSTTFQTRCGVSSAAAAYEFIHHPELRANGLWEISGPLAVVGTVNFGISRVDNKLLRPSGCSLALLLTDDDKYPDRPDWSQIYFENFIGQVAAEIAALQGTGTNLPIDSINLMESKKTGPENQTPDQRNVYWLAFFEVNWSRL